jgi:hypothetical protein
VRPPLRSIPGARTLGRFGHAGAIVRVLRPAKASQAFTDYRGRRPALAPGLYVLDLRGGFLAPIPPERASSLLGVPGCSRRLARALRRHGRGGKLDRRSAPE